MRPFVAAKEKAKRKIIYHKYFGYIIPELWAPISLAGVK